MKNKLTENELVRLRTRGNIWVSRNGKRVRVGAGDSGVLTFDGRYRTLAAALLAGPEPVTRPASELRISYDPQKLGANGRSKPMNSSAVARLV